MGVGHAPVVAPAGGAFRLGEGGADHDGVRAGGDGLAEVAALLDAAVGDDGHVAAGPLLVGIAGGGAVNGGGDLGHAHAEHLAGGAGGAGADPDEDAGHALLHELEAGRVADAVADHDGHLDLLDHLRENEPAVALGDVAGGGDGGLDDEDIAAGFLDDGGEPLGVGGDERDGAGDAGLLDFLDAARHDVFLDGLRVNLLEEGGDLVPAGGGDFIEHLVRVLVAGLDAVQVEDGETAELAHADGHAHVHDAVHGGSDDGDLEGEPGDLEIHAGLVRIDGNVAGNDGDIIEAVGAFELFEGRFCRLAAHLVLLIITTKKKAMQPEPSLPRAGFSGVSEKSFSSYDR